MKNKVESYGRDLKIISKKDPHGNIIMDAVLDRKGDLDTLEERDLMIQAIRHRLITRKGELASLGHPEYGSLLEEIIGEPNIPDTHRIIETLVRDCLADESRIRNVERVVCTPSRENPHVVHISLEVTLIKKNEDIKITYPLYLEE